MNDSTREWVPAGSVPYDTAYVDGDYEQQYDDGSVPYFSTVPYNPTPVRDPRMCIGNERTCLGWKSAGTDFCAGHRKNIAKHSNDLPAVPAEETD